MTAVIDWPALDILSQQIHVYLQITGVIGGCTYVSMFFLVQSGRICGNGVLYPCMQLFAASCVLASLTTAFNLAAFVIQVCFILIAAYGIWYRITGRLSARLERVSASGQAPRHIEIAHHRSLAGADAQSRAPANLHSSPVTMQADRGGQGHSRQMNGPDIGWGQRP